MQTLNLRQFNQPFGIDEFYCNDFRSHLRDHHAAITKPHKHDFYLVVIFTQGSGRHEIDFETYKIDPYSVFFLKPGQMHHWEVSDDIDGYIFFHSKAFYDTAFTNQSVQDYPFFSLRYSSHLQMEDDSMVGNFISLLDEYQRPDQFSRQKVLAILSSVYVDFLRAYQKDDDLPNAHNRSSHQYLQELERLVEDHFLKEKSPAAYAEMLNVSPRHLNRMVQESLGISTQQFIINRIILEAKRLFMYMHPPLAQVAYRLGYDDYAYFSRLFKQQIGLTPMEFYKRYH